MAEPMTSTTLAPTAAQPSAPTVQPVEKFMGVEVAPPVPDGGYTITIRRFSAAGDAKPLVAHIPEHASPEMLRNNPVLLAAVLKDGDPTWRDMEPGFVLVAVLKAAGLGLDILEGDIYPVEGRLGTSDWAKIKYARARGFSAAVRYTTGPKANWAWETRKEKGIWEGTADSIAVDVKDRNDKVVSTYETTLKAWWEGRSQEWRNRPAESLRRKALARAYQEVCPVGVDPEEAPPLDPRPSIIMESTAGGMSQAQSVAKAQASQIQRPFTNPQVP
jgi:hypothetical protein